MPIQAAARRRQQSESNDAKDFRTHGIARLDCCPVIFSNKGYYIGFHPADDEIAERQETIEIGGTLESVPYLDGETKCQRDQGICGLRGGNGGALHRIIHYRGMRAVSTIGGVRLNAL
jgi:hypothetical protein